MELETNLIEYGKSIIMNIKKGIDIYKFKINDEKEKFNHGIDELIKILTRTKEEFIYRTAQIDHKYLEIHNRIEKIEKLSHIDISEAANEINSNFCSVNKEFCDFVFESKNYIKKEIIEEINKFPSVEKNNNQITSPNKSKDSLRDSLIIQNNPDDNFQSNQQSNKVFSNSSFNQRIISNNKEQTIRSSKYENFEKIETNTKRQHMNNENMENPSVATDCFLNYDRKYNSSVSNNDFIIRNENCNLYNKNKFYRSPTTKANQTSRIIAQTIENKSQESNIREYYTRNLDYESKGNNLDNSQIWIQAEFNSTNENQNEGRISNQEKKLNLKSSKNFEPLSDNQKFHTTINIQNQQNEKFLNRKRSKTPDSDKYIHRFKNNINLKFVQIKNKESPTSEISSFYPNPEHEKQKIEDKEIAQKLKEIFYETGFDFDILIYYLKNKIIKSFEFNIMNIQTVSKQIEKFSIKFNQKENEDYSILLKITTKSEDCSVKSPLHLHLKELFHHRCSAFKNKDIYIGGICKMHVRELFKEISLESFMKFYNIISVNIILYHFFEDILNDLDDINANSMIKNFSKKEEKEKRKIQILIKEMRRQYEILSKQYCYK